jgi:hypothetical protein
MTKTKTRDATSIQFGGGIRLNDEQRNSLRLAFSNSTQTDSKEVEGKGISVTTHTISDIETELRMDRTTFSSLVSARTSINLPLALRLQKVLNVELITEADLRESFESFVDYLKKTYW